ncbi:putative structure-specific endonuclease subunit SLX4 [Cercophora samala]|uniref:Structure-specific endonuclease subunit SLX4 n=1 Tax=Cercophora samala TaxID=330535 RepID=A0AA40DCM8_9PEZI|nr:putative structure-specific endonuclease subunit SLX4 [Cercophora samala]
MFSSPPRSSARDESLVIISSSPEFPSLCDLVPTKKPTILRSGKTAATIPSDASTTFTSAATAWRDAQDVGAKSNSGLEGEISVLVTKDTALVKPKPNTKPRGPTNTSTKKASQPPAPQTDDSVMVVMGSSGIDVSIPKKRGKQAKKIQDPAQTTIAKGKVTKPATKEKVTRKKVETVSRHFVREPSESNHPPTSTTDAVVSIQKDGPVILEPAMRRRFDWTPPRENLPQHVAGAFAIPPVVNSPVERSTCSEESPEANVFQALHDKFGRKSDDVRSISSGSGSGTSSIDVLGKRKLIEMVQTAAASISNINADSKNASESPVKSKAVKKKPRTITELATAAYRHQEESSNQESLLGYLDTTDAQTGSSNTVLGGKGKGGKRPTKPRPSKKKPEPKKPILLSPESALRQVAHQDFVFGTSSQLAIEDDPDLLRALHEAMKLSNDTADDPFASPSPGTSDLAVRRKPARLLWGASARDGDGELLDLEILDLTESPPLHSQSRANVAESVDDSVQMIEQPLPPPTKEPLPMKETSPPAPGAEDPRHTSNSIFDTTDSSAEMEPKPQPPPKFTATKALAEEIPEPNDTDWDDLDFDLPPSNQEHHELLLTQGSSPQLAHSPTTPSPIATSPSKTPSNKQTAARPNSPPQSGSMAPSRPKYELFTDAQLARDISKFGFKPVKKRSAMIALLDQCWASRVQSAVGGAATNALMMSTTTAQAASKRTTAPPSPRGRPRKNSGTVTAAVDYSSLKVPELKKLLQERSLKQSGNKPDLIARLQDYDVQRNTAAGGLMSPRGRPRKDASRSPKRAKSPARRVASPGRSRSPATTPRRSKPEGRDGIIEIPDSDADSDLDDPLPSSPPSSARRARPAEDEDIFSSPPRVNLSIVEDTEMSLVASPTTEQVSVFAYITKAITTAPPSKDPTDPSWYDKILMYDPIILEDLASWLNAGQLDKVGFDGEVSPADVKQWCESKSVCCLWRVSLRGLERKRL